MITYTIRLVVADEILPQSTADIADHLYGYAFPEGSVTVQEQDEEVEPNACDGEIIQERAR